MIKIYYLLIILIIFFLFFKISLNLLLSKSKIKKEQLMEFNKIEVKTNEDFRKLL